MGKKRIVGIDRAFMFMTKAARKYWEFYCPARRQVIEDSHCNICGHKVSDVEVDHCPPLGERPRFNEADPRKSFIDFADWMHRLFLGPQRGLCHKHHSEVTAEQRKKRCASKTKKNV